MLQRDPINMQENKHEEHSAHDELPEAGSVSPSPRLRETSSSLIGGVHSLLESAEGACRDIKRAESAESA